MEKLQQVLSELPHLNLEEKIVDVKPVRVPRNGSSCDLFTAWSERHQVKVAVKRIRVPIFQNEDAEVSRSSVIPWQWTSLSTRNLMCS